MTVTSKRDPRYIYKKDTTADFAGYPIRITDINQPFFCMLLGADATLSGSIIVEESTSTEAGNVFGPEYVALAWVPVGTPIAIAAGLFTANASKGYVWPDSTGNPLWQTGAEAIRLRFVRTAGGGVAQLNVGYHGKSQG